MTHLCLGAAGWVPGVLDAATLQGPQVRLYVWDKATEWAWHCSVPREVFATVAADAAGRPELFDDIRGCLGWLICEGATPTGTTPDWEQMLGTALCAYAGTTQVYAAHPEAAKSGHFIVLNYRSSTPRRESRLRPFIHPAAANEVLLASQFRGAIQQVVAGDQARHPEWFQ